MPTATEYSEPVTLDVIDGQVETLVRRRPGQPADLLLGVAGNDGAAMTALTVEQARELAGMLAKLADEAAE